MMSYIPNIVFFIVLVTGLVIFIKNIRKLIRNIKIGKPVHTPENKPQRWRNMILMALGQKKMFVRPISGLLHVIVYIGFIIINIEVLEIIIDGILGTHRVFAPLGTSYDILIGAFEILALLVIVAVLIFWIRRNILKLRRFIKPEMKAWPKNDANIILYFELVLMLLFLTMNATDHQLQQIGSAHYNNAGAFPVSRFINPLLSEFSETSLIILERISWWLHIVGILIFLNYLYYSKHLHILLAFPNTWYASLRPKGQFNNLAAVTKEVQLMLDPNTDPFAAPPDSDTAIEKFGASDVTDLSRIQLMNAYSCTECGRCTDECPANQTGKKLSPRKIMMDTRDRLEKLGKTMDRAKKEVADDKPLLDHYISQEELWACTTCNACVEACPIGIDPLSIILDMRRYLVMEQSAAPAALNVMMTNVEYNGSPWPYNQMDRLNWKEEI